MHKPGGDPTLGTVSSSVADRRPLQTCEYVSLYIRYSIELTILVYDILDDIRAYDLTYRIACLPCCLSGHWPLALALTHDPAGQHQNNGIRDTSIDCVGPVGYGLGCKPEKINFEMSGLWDSDCMYAIVWCDWWRLVGMHQGGSVMNVTDDCPHIWAMYLHTRAQETLCAREPYKVAQGLEKKYNYFCG
jgi:hypothetical protein